MDLGLGLVYKPDGFTEPMGEIEAALSVGRGFGEVRGLLNVVYGQDLEGRDRDGEVKLAAGAPVGERAALALDSRLRIRLPGEAAAEESEADRAAEGEADWDLIAGPALAVRLGPVVLSAQAGVQAIGKREVAVGAVALGGVGFGF